jgi:hypothetical protein
MQAVPTSAGPVPADWQDHQILHRNRLPAHVPLRAYPDEAAALTGQTPYALGLDGEWSFLLARSPHSAPAGFHLDSFDASDWARIPVPASWQMPEFWRLQDFDRPIYTNIRYPIPVDPPRVPDENATGCYRTRFTLPAAWAGRRTTIVFESVDSAFHCWLNGHTVPGTCANTGTRSGHTRGTRAPLSGTGRTRAS